MIASVLASVCTVCPMETGETQSVNYTQADTLEMNITSE